MQLVSPRRDEGCLNFARSDGGSGLIGGLLLQEGSRSASLPAYGSGGSHDCTGCGDAYSSGSGAVVINSAERVSGPHGVQTNPKRTSFLTRLRNKVTLS